MPLPSSNTSGISGSSMGATADLGLGDLLADQVAGETEEMRRKRMQEEQQRRMMGSAGTPATFALFGGMNGIGR